MKFKIKYGLICSAVLALSTCAHAQLTSTTLRAVTNTPAIVTAIAGSNTTTFIDINNNSGLAISWQFNVSAGTSNADLLMYPSVDKTNYETTPWVLERNAAGTTDRIATTNWDANKLRGYTSLKIGAMTNANNGTLTNKGLQFSRPNS
jgi:hypothetical protein